MNPFVASRLIQYNGWTIAHETDMYDETNSGHGFYFLKSRYSTQFQARFVRRKISLGKSFWE